MKIAINGFGRIGRNVFRIAFERKDIEIAAINDITSPETLAHLLKYDSTYGTYKYDVETTSNGIKVNGREIPILAIRNPAELPWAKLGIDVAVESTGLFRTASGERGGYKDHIRAGAKKVVLTVPAKDDIDQTVVLGVNDDKIDLSNEAFSNASCTTNCLAPVVKVLSDSFGIKQGLMTTVHAYTNDQKILDLPHADLRRARAAAINVIPTSTGAAKAVGLVLPVVKGKLNGMAMRVPVAVGSSIDLVCQLEKDVTVEDINKAIKKAAEGSMKGVLRYSEEDLVTTDIKGDSHSSIFDSKMTMVLAGGFVKVLSWYDNEMGYSTRVVDLMQKLVK